MMTEAERDAYAAGYAVGVERCADAYDDLVAWAQDVVSTLSAGRVVTLADDDDEDEVLCRLPADEAQGDATDGAEHLRHAKKTVRWLREKGAEFEVSILAVRREAARQAWPRAKKSPRQEVSRICRGTL
jgi:hypothetical protein